MHPQTVDAQKITGAEILDDVTAWVQHYVAFSTPHAAPTVALWAAHTWRVLDFYVSPRLILSSAEPGSGKTRVLELLNLVSHFPRLTISATAPALYRRIAASADEGKLPPTILFDEVDAVFSKGASPNHEDLRALLNSGYKRGSTVDRCKGDAKNMEVVEFPVFAPVALAGLAGNMPATITTRAVTIEMRRRGPGEIVAPFRERDADDEAQPLREDLAEWMCSLDGLDVARPAMPKGVEDRPAEVWEALLAIADAAGGHWPATARAACKHFVLDTADPRDTSLGIRLLADIREVLAGRDRIATDVLLSSLRNLDEAPWGDLYGKPLTPRRLATELKRYGVRSNQVRLPDGTNRKAYTLEPTGESVGLQDAFNRFLTGVIRHDPE